MIHTVDVMHTQTLTRSAVVLLLFMTNERAAKSPTEMQMNHARVCIIIIVQMMHTHRALL